MPKRIAADSNIDPTLDSDLDLNVKAESSPPLSETDSSPSSTPKKKPKTSPKKSTPKEKAGTKTAWNAEEDEILLGMMDQLIKNNLWALIKADGRLVHRTSYGAQYHARMLLAKGAGGKAK